jgi:glycosyltransferase involved in cell wall biosynthesis
VLRVALLTRGSPTQITGGHLYQRRMAEAAARHGAVVDFVSVHPHRDPLSRPTDVVLVDSIAAWSVAPWVLLSRRRPPLAAVLHQPPGGVGQGRVRTAVQRRPDLVTYRRCRLLIAASSALGEALVVEDGLPRERVCVVEPGSDLPTTTPPPEGMRHGRHVALLSVGNWSANKGVLELLEAVATLPPDAVTLHLAGRQDVDEVYTRDVRARLQRPDLAGRVVVHGVVSRDEVARLYAGADVFALTSYAETYGTVHGEALAAGLPTVGWRSGNLPNLITDGREGCLVQPGDVRALAGILLRLVTDDGWREDLRRGARRRGRTLPTWDQAAGRFFAALSELVPDRG